jgi:hypothetical protein
MPRVHPSPQAHAASRVSLNAGQHVVLNSPCLSAARWAGIELGPPLSPWKNTCSTVVMVSSALVLAIATSAVTHTSANVASFVRDSLLLNTIWVACYVSFLLFRVAFRSVGRALLRETLDPYQRVRRLKATVARRSTGASTSTSEHSTVTLCQAMRCSCSCSFCFPAAVGDDGSPQPSETELPPPNVSRRHWLVDDLSFEALKEHRNELEVLYRVLSLSPTVLPASPIQTVRKNLLRALIVCVLIWMALECVQGFALFRSFSQGDVHLLFGTQLSDQQLTVYGVVVLVLFGIALLGPLAVVGVFGALVASLSQEPLRVGAIFRALSHIPAVISPHEYSPASTPSHRSLTVNRPEMSPPPSFHAPMHRVVSMQDFLDAPSTPMELSKSGIAEEQRPPSKEAHRARPMAAKRTIEEVEQPPATPTTPSSSCPSSLDPDLAKVQEVDDESDHELRMPEPALPEADRVVSFAPAQPFSGRDIRVATKPDEEPLARSRTHPGTGPWEAFGPPGVQFSPSASSFHRDELLGLHHHFHHHHHHHEHHQPDALRPWLRLFDAQLARIRRLRRAAAIFTQAFGAPSAIVTVLFAISGLCFLAATNFSTLLPPEFAYALAVTYFCFAQLPLIAFAAYTQALRQPLREVATIPAGVLAQCASARSASVSIMLSVRAETDAVCMAGTVIDPGSAIRIAVAELSILVLALQQVVGKV